MAEDVAWDRMVDAIDTKFGLSDHGRLTRKLADAPELTEAVAFVVFERDGTRIKLERTNGPSIIDRKTVGARRAGADLHYENVYDPSELSRRTLVYREVDNSWEPIGIEELGLAG
jgi:hypothetical protein